MKFSYRGKLPKLPMAKGKPARRLSVAPKFSVVNAIEDIAVIIIIFLLLIITIIIILIIIIIIKIMIKIIIIIKIILRLIIIIKLIITFIRLSVNKFFMLFRLSLTCQTLYVLAEKINSRMFRFSENICQRSWV